MSTPTIDLSPLAAATLVLGALNLAACICRLGPMHVSTHKAAPQWGFVALALAAILCSTMAAYGLAVEGAVCVQLMVSAALLHTLDDYRHGTPMRTWRDSVLILQRTDNAPQRREG